MSNVGDRYQYSKAARRKLVKRSQQQERRIARTFSATQHAGSGNKWVNKNDAHTDNVLFECKTTDGRKQITIKDDDLNGLRVNAARVAKEGVLCFDLTGRNYVVISEGFFHELLSAWEEDTSDPT